jgi:hypothetical protein
MVSKGAMTARQEKEATQETKTESLLSLVTSPSIWRSAEDKG